VEELKIDVKKEKERCVVLDVEISEIKISNEKYENSTREEMALLNNVLQKCQLDLENERNLGNEKNVAMNILKEEFELLTKNHKETKTKHAVLHSNVVEYNVKETQWKKDMQMGKEEMQSMQHQHGLLQKEMKKNQMQLVEHQQKREEVCISIVL
tara:strand:- start:60 stop:524 length:465 start_codon:yes stop_codon:yes gene_type:complete